MKNGYTVAYAASFGDPTLMKESRQKIQEYMQNFKYIGLREQQLLPLVAASTSAPVQRVVDPTLLLTAEDLDKIAKPTPHPAKYVLLYARRYDPPLEQWAEDMAAYLGAQVVEISLRATNADSHTMRHDAGVEEFLILVKNACYVVTNSYHGMIMAIHYKRPFVVFSREQCSNKIAELLELLGLQDRMLLSHRARVCKPIRYDLVHQKIANARDCSIDFLKQELEGIYKK